ncbi:MAG: hypothetical protein GEU93_07490 [Propionibacteriales bacterium]|nr:hypothetical protein [Propionibacteriales bacterium]
MAQKVYLHVGTMKAATSYLQAMLDRNTERLAESKVLWSGAVRNRQAVGDLIGNERRPPGVKHAWSKLAREIGRYDGDAVISMELLAQAGPRKIRRLARSLEPAELHLILTARQLTRQLPSHWQEVVQNRQTMGWEDFLAHVCTDALETSALTRRFWRHHDVADIIRRWSDAAPVTQVSVVTVPTASKKPDEVWRRFSSVLGLGDGEFRSIGLKNQSLGGVSAELMRRVNLHVPDLDWQRYRWGFKNALAKQTLATRAGSEPRLALPAERHAWVRARAERMIRELGELDVTVVGDLADLLPPAEPSAADFDPDGASEADLLAAATEALAGMGTRLAELRIERDQLLDQVAQQKGKGRRTAPGTPAAAPAPVSRSRLSAGALRFARRVGVKGHLRSR